MGRAFTSDWNELHLRWLHIKINWRNTCQMAHESLVWARPNLTFNFLWICMLCKCSPLKNIKSVTEIKSKDGITHRIKYLFWILFINSKHFSFLEFFLPQNRWWRHHVLFILPLSHQFKWNWDYGVDGLGQRAYPTKLWHLEVTTWWRSS